MALNLVQTLGDLVAIPSVNPMGRPLRDPPYLENRLTDYLARLFDQLGLPWQRQTVHPGRDNIVGWLDGGVAIENGGRVLLWDAHQDTVPVEGMTVEPWTPVVRDGRLYGRGACDIKGGMTAMLGALARLADERPPGRPTIVMACTVNEEHGFSGAKAICRDWQTEGKATDKMLPFALRPDACVVAEPTNLDVVVAHKGVVRWRCHTHGRAAHSSQPELGENAIFAMSRVLLALEAYQRDVTPTLGEHPLCGRPTLSVGTIAGGLSVNTVPDRATIEIDRRLLPGEDPLAAQRAVIEFVAARANIRGIEHEPPMMSSAGLSDVNNLALAIRLREAAGAVSGRSRSIGVPFGTNATAYAAAGAPTVVFGPGSIAQAHTADEWLPLDELHQASEILYRFAKAGVVG